MENTQCVAQWGGGGNWRWQPLPVSKCDTSALVSDSSAILTAILNGCSSGLPGAGWPGIELARPTVTETLCLCTPHLSFSWNIPEPLLLQLAKAWRIVSKVLMNRQCTCAICCRVTTSLFTRRAARQPVFYVIRNLVAPRMALVDVLRANLVVESITCVLWWWQQ